jgi:hypothetical protein
VPRARGNQARLGQARGLPLVLSAVAQGVVGQHEGGHGLDHRDGARQHARIVAAAAPERCVFQLLIDGVLLVHDGGHWLEGDTEVDGLAVGDAALHTAGVVFCHADFAAPGPHGVVVLAAGHGDATEAGADFEALGRGQAEHRLGQVGLESVEHRVAPANGQASCDTLDQSADGVAGFAGALDQSNHFVGDGAVRAADNVGLDIAQLDLLGVDVGDDFFDLFNVGQHFDAVPLFQKFLGHGTGGDAADSFARAGAAAALPVAEAEFLLVRVVGMRGAELGFHFRVGLGAEIFVVHHHHNGCAEGFTLEGAGENLDFVGLVARRDDLRLAGTASVEVGLNVRLVEIELRWAAVEHDANAPPVGFAPGGDAEQMAERVWHAPIVWQNCVCCNSGASPVVGIHVHRRPDVRRIQKRCLGK